MTTDTTPKIAETIGRLEREARRLLREGDLCGASELRAEMSRLKTEWSRKEASRIAKVPYHGTDDKGD